MHFISPVRVVTLSLEPPAANVSGVLSFQYCPNNLVSVNVTCKAEGVHSPLSIKPQVIIGPKNSFYLANECEVDKWKITLYCNNLSLLYFNLPLTNATDDQGISCKSENISSQSITLQESEKRRAMEVVNKCSCVI